MSRAFFEKLFERRVLLLVIGHDHMRAIRDAQIVADGNAALAQTIDFIEQLLGVNDDAVADDVDLALAQDARRNQMQRIALRSNDHGVSRVGAAVVTHDAIESRREQINDFPFAFVAPLEPDNSRVNRRRKR